MHFWKGHLEVTRLGSVYTYYRLKRPGKSTARKRDPLEGEVRQSRGFGEESTGRAKPELGTVVSSPKAPDASLCSFWGFSLES